MEKGIAEYEKIEETFFRNIRDSLGENLALYCVTGSLARKDIIPGWSDIDILVVIKQYSFEIFTAIS